jgi:hypothetical protein
LPAWPRIVSAFFPPTLRRGPITSIATALCAFLYFFVTDPMANFSSPVSLGTRWRAALTNGLAAFFIEPVSTRSCTFTSSRFIASRVFSMPCRSNAAPIRPDLAIGGSVGPLGNE